MTREQRRDGLFMAAAALPEGEREAFLRAECESDPELVEEVLSLLAADAGSAEFVEGVVSRAARDVLVDAQSGPLADKRVGPYVLERLLGSGGMGTVYLARRADHAFDMHVAIKLIRLAADGTEARRRFLAERRILAKLEHPYIARLLDGGRTDDGAPYVVMEYVRGQPITTWADEQRLDVTARLRLFGRICEAVQHAHASLVVHRDLKPSNVLITTDGSPRLIDFGIAKLLDDASPSGTTRTGARMLTPEYASPEQLRGEQITVATDVYSLGVLLYELLTGRWPYDEVADHPRAREEAVLEASPRRPSTAAAQAGAGSDLAAAVRRSDPRRLCRRLRGDLDTIVLTALRKEPSRRYASVAALGDDIHRHLTRTPLAARPDTLPYRVTRFVQRHWVGLSAASLVGIALGGGAIAAWTGLLQARAAQERAEASTARAEEVSGFLTDLLSLVDPDRARGQNITVREVLDTAVARLEPGRGWSDDAEVRASLLFTIGESYLSLGELTAATPVLRRAWEMRTDLYGALDERVLETDTRLGEALWQRGELQAAQTSAQRVLEGRRRTVGERHSLYGAALMNVGITWLELGRYDLAEPMLREALAVGRESLRGEERVLLSYRLNWLATLLSDTGRWAEAIELHEESLALRRRYWGETNLDIITGLTMFATTLERAGRLADAEATAREAIEHAEVLIARDHPARADADVALARALQHQGRLAEAEPLLRSALDAFVSELGPTSWKTAITRGYLGQILLGLDRNTEAEMALEQAWLELVDALPRDHPRVTTFALEVASIHDEAGDGDGNDAWLRRAA